MLSDVFAAALPRSAPRASLEVQSRTTASAKKPGYFGDHRIVFVDEMHALGRDRADDGWNTICHALVDFPLTPAPNRSGAMRPLLVEDRFEILNVAQNTYVLAGSSRIFSGVFEPTTKNQLRQPLDNQRQNLLDEINDGVDIGRMGESTDENNMLAILETRRCLARNIHDGREQPDFDSGHSASRTAFSAGLTTSVASHWLASASSCRLRRRAAFRSLALFCSWAARPSRTK